MYRVSIRVTVVICIHANECDVFERYRMYHQVVKLDEHKRSVLKICFFIAT